MKKFERTVDLETRKVRYFSVSSLQLADPDTQKGCLRKWWFEKVLGNKEPDNENTDRGHANHLAVANYLTTGIKAMPGTVMAGLHMMPTPGPDLQVEVDLVPLNADGSADLSRAPLLIAGAPLVGQIDVKHHRAENRGIDDVSATHDPPGTVKIIDWKFPKSLRFALGGADLVKTIQMAGYAKHAFTVEPGAELVRISHGYMPVSGPTRMVSALVDRDQVERTWEHATRVAGSSIDAARETDPDKVPANPRACRAYGRPCIHMEYCSAGKHNSLAGIIGTGSANRLLGGESLTGGSMSTPSLFERIKTKTASAGPGLPPTINPPGLPTTVDQSTALQVEMAKLKQQEEDAARRRAGAALLDLCAKIEAVGLGFPALSGAAAAAVSAARGISMTKGAGLAGSGELADFTIDDPEQLSVVLNDAAEIARERAAEASPTAVSNAIVPPDAPESLPVTRAAEPAPGDAGAAIAAVAEPRKRASRKKEPAAAPVVNVVNVAEPQGTKVTVTSTGDMTTINLYVDCLVDGIATTSLWPVVDALMAKLAVQSGAVLRDERGAVVKDEDGDPIPTDVRLADPNGPMGFGRWKAALGAYIREVGLEPANYVFDGAMTEIGGAVIEAMRDVVRRSGGIFVKGAR